MTFQWTYVTYVKEKYLSCVKSNNIPYYDWNAVITNQVSWDFRSFYPSKLT